MSQSLTRRDVIAAGAATGASAVIGPVAAQTASTAPNLIVRNARITTMSRVRPEAQALAVSNGRLSAVGTDAQVIPLAGPGTQVIDANGSRLIPGLTDTHTHTVREGLNYSLELRWDGIPTFAEAMARLRDMVRRTPPGHWVRVVGGFSPWQFGDEKRMPTIAEINAIAPETPVYVLFVYTNAIVNRAALQALKIDRATPDNRYPSAKIERDSSGNPTGMLIADPAPVILYSTLFDAPRLSFDEAILSTRHFMREQNRLGITSTLDCGGGFQNWPDDYAVVRELARRGEITVRIGASTFIQRPGKELEDFRAWTSQFKAGEGDEWFRLIGDGEMLVLSAYDYEIFSGPRVTPSAKAEPELEAVLRLLIEKKWPFRFHATYGETITRHLDVMERIARDMPLTGLNWIVDHGETMFERDIERVARLGGGIAVQNRIAFQEREFVDRYGAAAATEAPPIKKMLAAGVPVGAGTDMSRVSSYDPWLCLEWLVTGKGIGGTPLLSERTRLDRDTALRIWTDNAWFSTEQQSKGRLEPGLLADFVLLSEDYFAIPDNRIREIRSVMTVVGGKVVWGADRYARLMAPMPPLTPDWSPVNIFGGVYRKSA
jgi:predicted amidohydrolase YtcJ